MVKPVADITAPPPVPGDLDLLASNMRHAARNGESVTIGGGIFTPEELAAGSKALAVHDVLVRALRNIKTLAFDAPELRKIAEQALENVKP